MAHSINNLPEGVSIIVTAPKSKTGLPVTPDWIATSEARADRAVSAANVNVLI